MRTARGIRALIAVAATSLPPVAIPLPAQEPQEKSPARTESDPVRRVPLFFGQVGLSPEQREEIYKIRRQHLDRIEALRGQIEQHEAKMMGDCEAVLTAAQRRQLEDRRAAAKEKAAGRAKAKEPAKPKRPATKAVK